LEAIKLPHRITDIKNNSFDENQENQHNYSLQASSMQDKENKEKWVLLLQSKFHPNVSRNAFNRIRDE